MTIQQSDRTEAKTGRDMPGSRFRYIRYRARLLFIISLYFAVIMFFVIFIPLVLLWWARSTNTSKYARSLSGVFKTFFTAACHASSAFSGIGIHRGNPA